MNVLLVGDHTENLSRFEGLLELIFSNMQITKKTQQTFCKSLQHVQNKWDLVIYMSFVDEDSKIRNDLLLACQTYSLPVLYIVSKYSVLNEDYLEILQMGVNVIISHDVSLDILRNGINYAVEGSVYLDPTIAKEVNSFLNIKPNDIQECPQLTKRQWDVFRLVAKGMKPDEIADTLPVKHSTVLAEQRAIIYRTNSKTLSGAIAKGFYYGWLKRI